MADATPTNGTTIPTGDNAPAASSLPSSSLPSSSSSSSSSPALSLTTILKSGRKCTLTPMNLHDAAEYAEFKSQREVCGWKSDEGQLQQWRGLMDGGEKNLFWIMLEEGDDGSSDTSTTTTTTSTATTPTETTRTTTETTAIPTETTSTKSSKPSTTAAATTTTHIKAGHISLDAYSSPPSPLYATPNRHTLTIHNLFVLPLHRSQGLARAAMHLIERAAMCAPYGSEQCHTLTLSTLHKSYFGPEPPGRIGRLPETGSNQVWYEGLGFEEFGRGVEWEEVLEGGEVVGVVAAMMRKRLR